MSRQLLMGKAQSSGTTTLWPNIFDGASGGQSLGETVMSLDGRLGEIAIQLNQEPGVGKEIKWEYFVNNVASGVSVTISGTDTFGINKDLVSFVATDLVVLKMTSTSTNNVFFKFYHILFSDNPKESMLTANVNAMNLSVSTTRYLGFAGFNIQDRTTIGQTEIVIPTPGAISHFHVDLTTAPALPATRTLAVLKGGAAQLQLTMGDRKTGVATGSFTVATGDIIVFRAINNTTVPAATKGRFSVKFTADNEGEFMMPTACSDQPSQISTEYSEVNHNDTWSIQALANNKMGRGGFKINNMFVILATAPGAGNNRRFVLQKNGSDTGLDLSISDTNTSNNVANTQTLASRDDIRIKTVPSSTPDNSYASVSFNCFFTSIVKGVLAHPF